MATNNRIQVEVPRDKWDRPAGGKPGNGNLYDSYSGDCCVLGHILRARGVRPEALDGCGAVQTVLLDELEPGELYIVKDFLDDDGYDLPWVAEMWNINDDEDLSEKQREKLLTKTAKDHGIDLVFTGGE